MQGIKGYQTGTPGYEIVRLKMKLIQLGNRIHRSFRNHICVVTAVTVRNPLMVTSDDNEDPVG